MDQVEGVKSVILAPGNVAFEMLTHPSGDVKWALDTWVRSRRRVLGWK